MKVPTRFKYYYWVLRRLGLTEIDFISRSAVPQGDPNVRIGALAVGLGSRALQIRGPSGHPRELLPRTAPSASPKVPSRETVGRAALDARDRPRVRLRLRAERRRRRHRHR